MHLNLDGPTHIVAQRYPHGMLICRALDLLADFKARATELENKSKNKGIFQPDIDLFDKTMATLYDLAAPNRPIPLDTKYKLMALVAAGQNCLGQSLHRLADGHYLSFSILCQVFSELNN